jgi:hypothetical protein
MHPMKTLAWAPREHENRPVPEADLGSEGGQNEVRILLEDSRGKVHGLPRL